MAEETRTVEEQGGLAPGGSEARRGALPQPLTSFVGREQAIEEVAGLLTERRLVTITGSGGCGKTRLAVEVARRVAERFGDGVRFVDLGPLDASAPVADAAAAALGVPSRGSLAPEESMVRALVDSEVLVLLDNCEHVAGEVAGLAHALLVGCPSVTILATSREPLRVDGETTWRVPSLTLPTAGELEPLAALTSSESGRLLCDRARLARPDLDPAPEDAEAMITICRHLDGIPLAIELAAARLRALAPGQVAEALADHFRILDAGPRTAPLRQRTLEASIEWTHDMLDDDERRLLRRLSVFAASFTAEDVLAVCPDTDLEASEVIPLLARLSERSMLQVEQTEAGTRYRMLESIRRFARIRLTEAGEELALRDRHLAHWLSLAERFKVETDTDPAVAEELVRGLAAHVSDFRSAKDHSLRTEQIDVGLRLAANLEGVFTRLSRGRELQMWLDELIATDDGSDPAARAAALVSSARLALYAAGGRTRRARAAEALEVARTVGDRELEVQALLLEGWARVFEDPAGARGALSEGLAVAELLADVRGLQFGHEALGLARLYEGDLTGAREAFERARDFAHQRGATAYHFLLSGLGYVCCLMGAFDDGEASFREAGELPVATYDRGGEDLLVAWRSVLDIYRGAYDEADRSLVEAIDRARAQSSTPRLCLLSYGSLKVVRGEGARALEPLREAGRALRVPAVRGFVAQAQRLAGDAAATTGDEEAAAGHWREAMATAEASESPVALCVASLGMAKLAAADGNHVQARTWMKRALRHAVGCGYAIGVVEALEALGVREAEYGDAGDAVRILAATDAERGRIGYVRFPVEVPAFEAAVSSVRARLGERFDEVWREGSVLDVGEAVALASAGEARPPRPPTGWEALTPAEVRVARLVGEGLTNAEIGERLFISRRTVQSHLRHVFSKLGILTRAELAAEVVRMWDAPT